MLERLGLICISDHDTTLMVPYISLFPLDVRKPVVSAKEGVRDVTNAEKGNIWNHLVFAADWHPTVLSSITVGTQRDGAVMYIGPDSLALVAHWPVILDSLLRSPHRFQDKMNILDVCCGSGVQAISLLAQLKAAGVSNCRATCVDINPRALRFSKFNALLNGFDDDRLEICCTDVSASKFTTTSMGKVFDFVLANPPFIPVPQESVRAIAKPNTSVLSTESCEDDTISRRYGLFSSGGASGEDVLKAVLRLSPRLLSSSPYAVVAIVSEFMNPGPLLTQKIKSWWKETPRNVEGASDGDSATGLLVTNEAALTAEVYASRRAGGDEEKYEQWRTHLELEDIENVSPGMLFIGCPGYGQEKSTDIGITHALLPKGFGGSVWTPHNNDAVKFALKHWIENVQ
jgi:methylase of polypeptide subunit release factors